MTISVLIAAYNAAPFLPAALASIAAQKHTDWELVVVEDGSHDGSEEIIARFAQTVRQRVRYENLGVNRGVAAARNRLMAMASGEGIAFLDADDEWQPTHLSDLNDSLARGAALAFSGIELWDGDRRVTIGTHIPPAAWISNPRRWLYEYSFIQTSSCVALPRSTFEKTGQIDETLRIGEDRDYWFRSLAGGGRLICTGNITCRYTKHEGSSMTKTLRVAADTVAFYRKHRSDTTLPGTLRRRLLANALWIHGRLLRATDRSSARKLFRAAFKESPLTPRYWPHLAF